MVPVRNAHLLKSSHLVMVAKWRCFEQGVGISSGPFKNDALMCSRLYRVFAHLGMAILCCVDTIMSCRQFRWQEPVLFVHRVSGASQNVPFRIVSISDSRNSEFILIPSGYLKNRCSRRVISWNVGSRSGAVDR